jgi:hypothetical protein
VRHAASTSGSAIKLPFNAARLVPRDERSRRPTAG